MKENVTRIVEEFLPSLWNISKEMYEHPEPGLQETYASKLLREWLAGQGFSVEQGIHGLPTAFRAVYGSGSPVIGFLCEYDALPEIGHGCGHDLIGVISAGAAASLREVVDRTGGTLVVYGTPDEEMTCTKEQLTKEGCFDELDVALMLHPYRSTCCRIKSLGNYPVQYEFFGKKCHATEAGAGGNCINALDAAVLAYNSINQVKQYLDGNIYGIVHKSGTTPSIIPDYASLRYYIRSDEAWKLQKAVDRVNRCAQAAADAVGADLKVTQYLCPIQPLLLVEPLMELFEKNIERLGGQVRLDPGCQISTDAGNVSLRIPTFHGMIGVPGFENLDLHTREFGEQTVQEGGREATRTGILALAGMAIDLLTEPDLLRAVKDDFARQLQTQSEGKGCTK